MVHPFVGNGGGETTRDGDNEAPVGIDDDATTFVGEYRWHNACIECSDCQSKLRSFRAHDNRPYCLDCFYANRATRCAQCKLPISGQYITHDERCICAKFWNTHHVRLLQASAV